MKVLISGMPCCGKTSFGDWLRDVHGFAHADLEPRATESGTIVPPSSSFELPLWLASLQENVVVTWGFAPCPGWLDLLDRFTSAGFTPWWFYADPHLARVRYAAREGAKKTADRFDPQLQILQRADDQLEAFYGERMIETLSAEGYKRPTDIYAAILDWAEEQAREVAASRAMMEPEPVAIPFAEPIGESWR